jgi:hypothetical protein
MITQNFDAVTVLAARSMLRNAGELFQYRTEDKHMAEAAYFVFPDDEEPLS